MKSVQSVVSTFLPNCKIFAKNASTFTIVVRIRTQRDTNFTNWHELIENPNQFVKIRGIGVHHLFLESVVNPKRDIGAVLGSNQRRHATRIVVYQKAARPVGEFATLLQDFRGAAAPPCHRHSC